MEAVLAERDGGVAIATLTPPERTNAVNDALCAELIAALATLNANPAARAARPSPASATARHDPLRKTLTPHKPQARPAD